MLMWADSESRMEQHHCEELEERCHREREGVEERNCHEEERNHRECQEADQRRELWLERQLQNQSEMMQMFMMSMMGGSKKRKGIMMKKRMKMKETDSLMKL